MVDFTPDGSHARSTNGPGKEAARPHEFPATNAVMFDDSHGSQACGGPRRASPSLTADATRGVASE